MRPFTSETITGPAYDSPLNDSLPHYQYRRIQDSVKRAEWDQEYFSRGEGTEYSFLGMGAMSVSFASGKEYLLSSAGYRLDEYVEVHNRKTGTVMSFPVWDITKNDTREGHLETRTTNIKYVEGKEAWEGKVYVPTTKTFGNIVYYLLIVLGILLWVVGFCTVLFVPIRFLWQLAKGRAFTEENIGSLYLTGWTLVTAALLGAVIKIIFHLLAQPQIPQGIEFSYYAAVMSVSQPLAIGLGVLLLAKAFLQGLELKEEQDLTV